MAKKRETKLLAEKQDLLDKLWDAWEEGMCPYPSPSLYYSVVCMYGMIVAVQARARVSSIS